MRWLLLSSIVLAGLAAVLTTRALDGGSAAAKDVSQTRVGRVQGSEAFIAVAYDGRGLRAYAVNGSARRPATLAKWFTARWDGRRAITMLSGASRLELEPLHADGRVSGTLDGRAFSAAPATGPAGLYERSGRRAIVLADGSQRSVSRPADRRAAHAAWRSR